MTDLDLHVNDVFTSIQFPEAVKIVAPPTFDGTHWHIMAVGVDTNQFYQRTLLPEDITVRRITFTGDGARFRLAVLAERIRAAVQYDPQFALGVAQIDPLPHQIEAVYTYMLQLPRIRFLLADDPGAGKTIMAGLLIKELAQRGVVERVLVVAPANLTGQWQDELQTRFNSDFRVVRGATLQEHSGNAIWRQYPRAIISVDLARRDEVRATFEGIAWDIVIVDEAHRMAAYRYGDRVDKTQAYQLGEELSERTTHLLLMTATPHRGNADNFRLLMALLDRDMFQSNEALPHLLRQTALPVFLRRLKEHMRDFDGKPLFPPRTVETLQYELEGTELELYTAVTEYVSFRFQRAEQATDDRTRRNVGLALSVLQRRMASSLRAIRTSLERRKAKLEEQRERFTKTGRIAPVVDAREQEEPDTDEERWEVEDASLAAIFPARTASEIDGEIAEVEALLTLARRAEQQQDVERKLSELRRVLEGLLSDGRNLWETGEKLLVFTENRDTLDYLVEKFMAWGFTVATIYGGMDRDRRRQAQEAFKDPQGAQILVATDAAGEGINLQFCRLMVNYDIPWNPNRLEQRMGRIHRYGQKFDVRIFNLVARNTREGNVLGAVFEKVEQMRQDLGRENVYDIIGDLLSATDLSELFLSAINERQTLDEIRAVVHQKLENNDQTRQQLQAALDTALASDALSRDALTAMLEDGQRSKEQRLVPEYIERFVVAAFGALCHDHGSRAVIRPRANERDVWMIDSVPHFIRMAAPDVAPSYPQLIFRKEMRDPSSKAELVIPGHPLFEALLRLVSRTYGPLLTTGARFTAPTDEQGLFWLFETTLQDGTGAVAGQHLVGIHQSPDGTCRQLDPLALLDVEPVAAPPPDVPAPPLPAALSAFASNPATVQEWCTTHIHAPHLQQVQAKRQREANVREDYLERSMKPLIEEQASKILAHLAREQERQRDPQQFDIALRTLEQRRDEYEARLAQRLRESQQMRAVGGDPPRLVGVCALVPPAVTLAEDEDSADPDVERIAVDVAMAYERAHGRTPHSVETSGLGYDLRSRGDGTSRYIEVKGRRETGAVSLTANEWIKAARFGSEYWLYVVYNCDSPQPRLLVIQDPAAHLHVTSDQLTAARFRVNMRDITRVGEAHAAPPPTLPQGEATDEQPR